MSPDRWRQVKQIFDQAIACEPPSRAAFLREACNGDQDLYHEVVSLVGSYDSAGTFFDEPLMAKPAPAPDAMIGREFGVYRIVREIGRGGMGSVYLATRTDDQFRRRVALKTIKPDLADDHTLRRFHNERQTLAVLDHPNIIKLIDGGQSDDGLPYLVMDYVEGQPVDEYCLEHKLSIRETLELFRTICAAVHYAHQNLVVHRDLKPSNILVTPDGTPKLLDFGIAKLLRPEYSAQAMGITRTRLQPMTPKYASPEQVLGRPITTASDVYALGVLLYELLTARHPFERQGSSSLELEKAIVDLEPEKPSIAVTHEENSTEAMLNRFSEARPESLSRLLRGDLDMIVLMAMRKEPQRRYASAEHLAEDVRRHIVGLPVLARKGTLSYRMGKFVRRHRLGVAAGFVVGASLATSAFVAETALLRARKRFQDLREFDNFVVNDLDELLRSGAGATPARLAVLGKAVESLDRLARDSTDDLSLEKDLITAYIKMGDVQGNFFVANLGEKDAADESYRKASLLAEALSRQSPADSAIRQLVAATYLKVGDALASRKEAIDQYKRALDIYRSLSPADREAAGGIMRSWDKIGSAQQQLGDDEGALETYRRCLEVARGQRRRSAEAYFKERVAYFAALNGDTAGAEADARDSISYYQQGGKVNPRSAAGGLKTLAEVQKRMGKTDAALESVRQSLLLYGKLLKDDPNDKLKQIDYQQAMVLFIDLLAASGQAARQRQETAHVLAFVKPLLDEPGVSEYQLDDYVRLLLTTPFPELQDNAAALRYARRLVSMTREGDPGALDLLAHAYGRNGDPTRAQETESRAISLLPPLAPNGRASDLRTRLNQNLQKFQSSHP